MKQTYAQPVVVEFVAGETSKVVASSGREVTALKLSAGAGAAYVALYDNPESANPTDKKWVLDASTSDNDAQSFANPLFFKKGIFAVLEQGVNLGAKLCIAIIPDQV